MSDAKRSREERYADDSSSDEEAIKPKMKPTSVTQKVTKLVSSSKSESEEDAGYTDASPKVTPQSHAAQSSHTVSVSSSIFSLVPSEIGLFL
jgi:hypothetical protein